MKKIKLLPALLMLLSVVAMACSSDENENRVNKLCENTWKLYGFGSDGQEIQRAEPSECSTCYTVKFERNGKFSGKTTTNESFGTYTVADKSFKIDEYVSTQVGEVEDGYKYVKAFCSSSKYEITDDGHLKLYYNAQNDFLIFNPQ